MKSTFIALLILAQCACVWAQKSVKLDWQALPPLLQAVGGHMSVWCDGKLFILGGTDWKDGTKSTFSNVWTYSPKEKVWMSFPSLPQPLAYGVAKSTFEGILVLGGLNQGKASSQIYQITFGNNKSDWLPLNPFPFPMAFSGGGVIKEKIYVLGFIADSQDHQSAGAKLYSHNLEDNASKWVQLPSPPSDVQTNFASASTKDALYIFGGMAIKGDSVKNSDEAWVYYPTAREWKRLHSLPIAARGIAACAISERYILLAGGYSDTFLNQVLLYDCKNNIYSKLTPLPYAAMGMQMVYVKDCVYVSGGEDAPRHRSNLFFVGKLKDHS